MLALHWGQMNLYQDTIKGSILTMPFLGETRQEFFTPLNCFSALVDLSGSAFKFIVLQVNECLDHESCP